LPVVVLADVQFASEWVMTSELAVWVAPTIPSLITFLPLFDVLRIGAEGATDAPRTG
jgi:hypothetical protein